MHQLSPKPITDQKDDSDSVMGITLPPGMVRSVKSLPTDPFCAVRSTPAGVGFAD